MKHRDQVLTTLLGIQLMIVLASLRVFHILDHGGDTMIDILVRYYFG